MVKQASGSGRRVPNTRITEQDRARFLDALAETSNVVLAAQRAGISQGAAYFIRRRDPVFAAQWRAALMTGYDRLEAALIRHALGETDRGVGADGDPPAGQLDTDLAIRLLSRHHATVADDARGNDAKTFRANRDVTGKTLVAKLRAYERRVQAGTAK